MSYGYQPDATAVLSGIGASFVITLIAYGVFPLFFALLRNDSITKKKYTWICFGVNVVVMAIFIATGSGGGAYFIWTLIFSAIGKKILENRGLIKNPNSNQHSENIKKPYSDASEKQNKETQNSKENENIVFKPAKVSKDAERPQFVEVNTTEEYTVCPCCGTKQFSKRKCCYNCAVPFASKTDSE